MQLMQAMPLVPAYAGFLALVECLNAKPCHVT